MITPAPPDTAILVGDEMVWVNHINECHWMAGRSICPKLPEGLRVLHRFNHSPLGIPLCRRHGLDNSWFHTKWTWTGS